MLRIHVRVIAPTFKLTLPPKSISIKFLIAVYLCNSRAKQWKYITLLLTINGLISWNERSVNNTYSLLFLSYVIVVMVSLHSTMDVYKLLTFLFLTLIQHHSSRKTSAIRCNLGTANKAKLLQWVVWQNIGNPFLSSDNVLFSHFYGFSSRFPWPLS